MTVNWGIVIQAFGLVSVFATALATIRGLRHSAKTQLKLDLEILKLLEGNEESHSSVKNYTDRVIAAMYSPDAEVESGTFLKVYSWMDLIFGVAVSVGFLTWTLSLIRDEHYFWAVITAFFAVFGLAGISNGFDPNANSKRKSRELAKQIAAAKDKSNQSWLPS